MDKKRVRLNIACEKLAKYINDFPKLRFVAVTASFELYSNQFQSILTSITSHFPLTFQFKTVAYADTKIRQEESGGEE